MPQLWVVAVVLHAADLQKLQVIPVHTYAYSYDEPARVRIINPTDEYVTIRVYRDRVDDGNLLREFQAGPGDIEYELFELGLLEPNRTTVIFLAALVDVGMDLTDWVVFATFNARWGRDDPIAYLTFVDEEEKPLAVDTIYYDLNERLARRGTGSGAVIFLRNNAYMEVYKDLGPGRKYYAILNPEDFEASASYQVRLIPQPVHYVKVTYKLDLANATHRSIIGRILPDSIEKIVDRLAGKALEFLVNYFVKYALRGARTISQAAGITLPIVEVHAEAEGTIVTLDVVYEQDIEPVTAAIIASIIISGIIAGITYYLTRRTAEQQAYEIVKVVYQYLGQKTQLTNDAINACKEVCGDNEDCFRSCVSDVTTAISKTTTHDEQLVRGTLEAYNEAKGESDKWKMAAAVAGGAAGVLLITRLMARGGK